MSSGLFKCKICGMYFDEKRLLEKHLINDHESFASDMLEFETGSFKCKFCGEQFDDKEVLEKHLMDAHDAF